MSRRFDSRWGQLVYHYLLPRVSQASTDESIPCRKTPRFRRVLPSKRSLVHSPFSLIPDHHRYEIPWQRDFFDHRLRHEESFFLKKKATYIRLNPVRAGLVAIPEEWPHVLAFDSRDGTRCRPGLVRQSHEKARCISWTRLTRDGQHGVLSLPFATLEIINRTIDRILAHQRQRPLHLRAARSTIVATATALAWCWTISLPAQGNESSSLCRLHVKFVIISGKTFAAASPATKSFGAVV